jgi:hypothetical protein
LNKGVKFGRKKIIPSSNFKSVYDDWKLGKISAVRAMDLVNLKSNTFYDEALFCLILYMDQKK